MIASTQDHSRQVPILELVDVSMNFGGVVALSDVRITIRPSAVTCLLGDNGAGKSTLIKVMSGVFKPSSGRVLLDGNDVVFSSPRAAQNSGIATVHQDPSVFPLMSIYRNFFLGRELTKGWGPLRRIDRERAQEIAIENLQLIGIRQISSGKQLVGTMSGGERQALAISMAVHFGARMLILDEPTSALGVKEAAVVLRMIQQAKARGTAVVFITHNAHHAISVGDYFTVLIQGSIAAQFARGEKSKEEVINLMAGGEALEILQEELEESDE
jgi:simple sugar transport system ATP-binding protein